jgi:LPXTG-site transpeptidase (sortase) family protein
MSEKPLLLSSARSGIAYPESKNAVYWRGAAVAIGIFVVLVGAADVTSRLARLMGKGAAFTAFAPAIMLLNSSPLSTSTQLLSHTSATTTVIIPARLVVPSIGVDAKVEQVGKKADGSMGTPSNFTDVAWYELGSKPGQPGNAVIDGHVNNALTTAGVFQHLVQLKVGDVIMVADQSDHRLTYVVTQVQEYAPDAPTDSIFSTTGPSQLVLITCDGEWVQDQHQFNKRLVVVASLQ